MLLHLLPEHCPCTVAYGIGQDNCPSFTAMTTPSLHMVKLPTFEETAEHITHPAAETPARAVPGHCFAVRTVLSAEGVGRSLSPAHSLSPRQMQACCSPHLQGCWGTEGAGGGPVPRGGGVRFLPPCPLHHMPWDAIRACVHLTPGRAFPSPCCTAPAVDLGTDV